MILLIIYWALLLPLFLGWGVFVHSFISNHFRYQNSSENLFVFILIGVCTVGLLANLCSFILPLGRDFYLLSVLYSLAVAGIIIKRSIVVEAIRRLNLFNITSIIFLMILVIVVCKSASPSELKDEKGYYLPFIKWVEAYGITPGLANLRGRLGFNSSWHILSALLSLRWSGTMFYDLNGFITLVVLGYYLLGVPKDGSSMRYICGLFVSAFIFRNFLTSSTADLPNIYLSSLVILWMLGKYENKTLGEIDYTFMVSFLISIYLVTIKPSSIFLLLIYLPTIIAVISKKQFNKILWLISIGSIFIVPWCVRFYITTGYLVFPVMGIDLFNPDWKVSSQLIIDERNAVKCFAILDTMPVSDVLKMSFTEWFPLWFKKSLIEQKAFCIAIILISLYYVATIKQYLNSLNDRLFIAIQGALFLNMIIWITQYPDFRFAWGYILVYVGIGICLIVQKITFVRNKFYVLIVIFLISMTSINLIRTCKDISGSYKNILVQQARFPEGEILTRNINNGTYYRSFTAWDLPLPSILWWENPSVELRKDATLGEGFRTVGDKK